MNAEQVGYFIKRNMPTILSIGAAVGVVVSNILTNKASIKATLKVDEVEKKKHRELTFIEEVKVVAPIYAPSIVVGAAWYSCLNQLIFAISCQFIIKSIAGRGKSIPTLLILGSICVHDEGFHVL